MNGWNQLIIYNDQLYSSIHFLSKHTNVRIHEYYNKIRALEKVMSFKEDTSSNAKKKKSLMLDFISDFFLTETMLV